MIERSEVVKSINRVSNKIKREFEKSPVMKELSTAEARTLYFLIDRKEPTFQRDIEEEYCLRPPSASRLLAKMENDGLIERVAVEGDGRFKQIIVTEKGMQHKDEILRKLRKLEALVTDGISDEELDVFFSVMERIARNLP